MNPFTHLTVDGVALEGAAILHWAEHLVEEHAGAPWTLELREALHELVTGDGTIVAHTSGTTGPPHPIRFTANDLRASARLTGQTFRLHRGDRALMCLGASFIAGRMMLVRGFVVGLDLHVVGPSGGVLDHLRTQDRFRFAAMVPAQLHRALQDDRSRLERQFGAILLGGGPVSRALEEDVQGLSVEVVQGYGSTETLTHVALRPLNGPARSDRYTAIGDIRFELDARDCLVVRTPHLSTVRHVTNDLVELLDERTFRWLGRADNVILTGGRKVHPEELELRTTGLLPFAHYFIGEPDDRLGQAVVLVVESSMPLDEVEREVRRCLTGALAPHEMPRRIRVHGSFERTSSGKVKRTAQEG